VIRDCGHEKEAADKSDRYEKPTIGLRIGAGDVTLQVKEEINELTN